MGYLVVLLMNLLLWEEQLGEWGQRQGHQGWLHSKGILLNGAEGCRQITRIPFDEREAREYMHS